MQHCLFSKKIDKNRSLLCSRITVTCRRISTRFLLELIALTLFSCTVTFIFEKNFRLRILSALSILNFEKFFAHFLAQAYQICSQSSSNDSVEQDALHGRNFSDSYYTYAILVPPTPFLKYLIKNHRLIQSSQILAQNDQ